MAEQSATEGALDRPAQTQDGGRFGMVIGTAFTLFVLPSIYLVFARNHSQMHGSSEFSGASPGENATDSELEPVLAER